MTIAFHTALILNRMRIAAELDKALDDQKNRSCDGAAEREAHNQQRDVEDEVNGTSSTGNFTGHATCG